MKQYKPVIGLEVHVELKTKSKMFCGCSTDYFGKEPNTHCCPVCLGLPGALPVPNKKAIEWCVMIGLALNCEIPLFSKFDRKNYFYPDLPKGYQISQYDQPFAVNGHIDIGGAKLDHLEGGQVGRRRVKIRRVHMEEDTAKLTHATVNGPSTSLRVNERVSLIDFNRSGVPLVEIVTEPDFESADEVVGYLKKLQQIVRYLGVSNADMEKGDMRLEPNISLNVTRNTANVIRKKENLARVTDRVLPSYKVEVKNINSFRFVDRAIEYEITRQRELLEKGETPRQETRGFSEEKNATLPQRRKEEAHDYRYFPEPDIPPVRWTEFQISNFKSQMPELPDAKFDRFRKDYELSDYDAEILTRENDKADYFEETVRVGGQHKITPKQIANAIINKKVDLDKTLPAEFIRSIVVTTATVTIDEEELESLIKKVLQQHQKAIDDYKKGKKSAIMFLVGQVIRNEKQKIDAQLVRTKLIKIMNSEF